MIRRVRLHPYKQHTDLTLDTLPLISVVVGPNNVGKSGILQALALPKYGIRWDPVLPTSPTDNPTEVANPLALIDYGYDARGTLTIQLNTHGDGSIQWLINASSKGTSSGGRIPQIGQYGEIQFQGVPEEARRVFFLGAYRAVPNRSFNYLAYARDIGVSGEGCWNALHQLKASDNPAFDAVRDALVDMGFGVEGVQTPTAEIGSGQIRLPNRGRADALPYLGSGTGSVLPVITQGVLCQAGETLLVEEPELHLHKGALGALARLFGAMAHRKVQTIMTSHSTEIFGSLLREIDAGNVPRDSAVFLLDHDDGGRTSFKRYLVSDYPAPANAANEVLRRSARPNG